MPRKPASPGLTPLELEIMQILWQAGPATVQAVQERLSADRPLAYTTVQTMLNVLARKGKVRRVLQDRAYVYRPAVSQQRAVKQAVRDFVDRFFGGSADALVLNLVETRRLKPEQLERLKAVLRRSHD